jgi:hypothetical protein
MFKMDPVESARKGLVAKVGANHPTVVTTTQKLAFARSRSSVGFVTMRGREFSLCSLPKCITGADLRQIIACFR